MAILGIIGGSGVYHLDALLDAETLDIDTPFGKPSAPLRRGTLGATELVFLARHGIGHTFSPTEIPYRANIFALKELEVSHLLSLSAVGSLRHELPPRSLVVPDQIIDRTVARARTFFDDGIVAHVGLADPFCARFRDALAEAALAASQAVHRGGAYVCIEGPQFSTRAESHLYRSWGASVIGMTAMPEARLAREAELCFATLAMVTDYDVWHESESDVSVDVVLSNLDANSQAANAILNALSERTLPIGDCACGTALDGAIVTAPAHVTAAARERIARLVGDRLADA